MGEQPEPDVQHQMALQSAQSVEIFTPLAVDQYVTGRLHGRVREVRVERRKTKCPVRKVFVEVLEIDLE